MKTEEQVLELFAEQNPVPLTDEVHLPTTEPYLVSLEKRSRVMMDLKEQDQAMAQPRLNRRLVAIAAAVVVVVAGVIVVAQALNRSEVPPATIVTTTTTETLPDTENTGFDALPTWTGLASAGTRVRPATFPVAFSFVAPELWGRSGPPENENGFVLVRQPVANGTPMPAAIGVFVADVGVERVVADFANFASATGGVISSPEQVQVGRLDALAFHTSNFPWTVETASSAPFVRSISFSGNVSYQTVGGETGWIVVVDVDGTAVVVGYWALDSIYEEYEPEAVSFVESIEWPATP